MAFNYYQKKGKRGIDPIKLFYSLLFQDDLVSSVVLFTLISVVTVCMLGWLPAPYITINGALFNFKWVHFDE